MKQRYIKRIQERLAAHFRATCQRLDPAQFVVGTMRYNYQCHMNSAHEAALNPDLSVVLCYCIDSEGFGFLHVINKTSEGIYIDHTLGMDYQRHQYFFIKMALPDSYPTINNWFDEIRKDYISLHGSVKVCRWLGIKPTDIF